jgi:hypothetical protein
VCIGVDGVKVKGNTKRVVKPNFWIGFEKKVPNVMKEMIYEQYLSPDLFVYCDASQKIDHREQSVACTYVHNASIVVKRKYVYIPSECVNINLYGEIESVIFALTYFTEHMMPSCLKVIIYSDVSSIVQWINGEATFKNPYLKTLQKEMILLYQKVKSQNSTIPIEVKYLPFEHKKYNPFYRSAHNAAYSMLQRD